MLADKRETVERGKADDTALLNAGSLRRVALIQSAAARAVRRESRNLKTASGNTVVPQGRPQGRTEGANLLLSTTIKEEENEELDSEDDLFPPSSSVVQRRAHSGAQRSCGTQFPAEPIEASAKSPWEGFFTRRKQLRSSTLTKSVIASASDAAARLLQKFMPRQQRKNHHTGYHDGSHPAASAPAAALIEAVVATEIREAPKPSPLLLLRTAASTPKAPTLRSTISSPSQSKPRYPTGKDSSRGKIACGMRRTAGTATASSPAAAAATRPPCPHLVRLIDGDDVSLGLRALQLAAEVHDHVFGPAGLADPVQRTALLEAAGPLYDEAMTAARAIRHPALQSLVKEAVRRYVDPRRGAPDDVLRLILELLTGAGATAAAGAGTAGTGPGGAAGARQQPTAPRRSQPHAAPPAPPVRLYSPAAGGLSCDTSRHSSAGSNRTDLGECSPGPYPVHRLGRSTISDSSSIESPDPSTSLTAGSRTRPAESRPASGKIPDTSDCSLGGFSRINSSSSSGFITLNSGTGPGVASLASGSCDSGRSSLSEGDGLIGSSGGGGSLCCSSTGHNGDCGGGSSHGAADGGACCQQQSKEVHRGWGSSSVRQQIAVAAN